MAVEIKPKISWKVTTMGRVSTLNETLFSYLMQNDLSDTEMVIVNDYPMQTLVFDHPRVRIFNEPPFATIGEKENFAVEQCKGDIIAVTDDDDVYMSTHNKNIKEWFKEDTNILHWAKGVFYNEPIIQAITGIGNSGMVYSKKAWLQVGKHPIMNAGGDTRFSTEVHRLGNKVDAAPEEVSAWYRWGMNGPDGNGIYHQSGMGTDDGTRPDVIQRHKEHIDRLRHKGLIPTGMIRLNPRWQYPYEKMLQDFIKKENGIS